MRNVRQKALLYSGSLQNSTRFDDERKCWIIPATMTKVRTAVERGEERPLCDAGLMLQYHWHRAEEYGEEIRGVGNLK